MLLLMTFLTRKPSPPKKRPTSQGHPHAAQGCTGNNPNEVGQARRTGNIPTILTGAIIAPLWNDVKGRGSPVHHFVLLHNFKMPFLTVPPKFRFSNGRDPASQPRCSPPSSLGVGLGGVQQGAQLIRFGNGLQHPLILHGQRTPGHPKGRYAHRSALQQEITAHTGGA